LKLANRLPSHKINITCPVCFHSQVEPDIVISTVCRSCGITLKITDRKAHYFQGNLSPIKTLSPVLETDENSQEVIAEKNLPFVKVENLQSESTTFIDRFLKKTPEIREVVCVVCDKKHHAPIIANASNCPSCGIYISLKSYVINDNLQRSIKTQGNVHVKKKGSVRVLTIECHDLIVEGFFQGNAQCTGSFTAGFSGDVTGKISCANFIVSPKEKIKSSHPINVKSAVIQGELEGAIIAQGCVTLHKKSIVIGNISAANIVMLPGAKHKGLLSIKSI
jgi:cytoskeletal protein CcmA (bactofilin family)